MRLQGSLANMPLDLNFSREHFVFKKLDKYLSSAKQLDRKIEALRPLRSSERMSNPKAALAHLIGPNQKNYITNATAAMK